MLNDLYTDSCLLAKAPFIIYGILLELCELCMPFKDENVDRKRKKVPSREDFQSTFSCAWHGWYSKLLVRCRLTPSTALNHFQSRLHGTFSADKYSFNPRHFPTAKRCEISDFDLTRGERDFNWKFNDTIDESIFIS